jgi:hypothetical protein
MCALSLPVRLSSFGLHHLSFPLSSVKTLRLLTILLVMLQSVFVMAAPASKSQQLTSPDQVPEGLAKSDWSSIRAAYEAGRHAFMPVEGGWQARNPGQQWTTKFDQRGFLTTPKEGGWTWGLELEREGDCPACMSANERDKGACDTLTFPRTAAVTEWFINDQRGLEHGWTLSAPAEIRLRVRGSLKPSVSAQSISFGGQLTYAGLKAWDATGTTIHAHFEATAEGFAVRYDDTSAEYPITIDPIAQQAYLKAGNNGGATQDLFGYSVAVEGDTVVVGALSEDSSSTGVNSTPDESGSAGAAYVFVRSAGVWIQQAYLKPAAVGLTQEGDNFGISVAVSGDTVVVGAVSEDSSTTGVNSTPNDSGTDAGAAYVFVRNGGVWSQQAYLKPAAVGTTQSGDMFGVSVAVSGDTVVVGAHREDSSTLGVQAGAGAPNESVTDAGAAYVFVRSAGVWTQEAYLKPAAVGTTQAGDLFGGAVAVSGDTVVVGAVWEDGSTTGVNSTPNESASSAGAAYVFVRVAGVWAQQAYLKPAAVGTTQAGDNFGSSVTVSGDTVVVGAHREDSSTLGVQAGAGAPNESVTDAGAAYVFVRTAGIWVQQAYLKPAAVGTTQVYDRFGISVAVSGDTLVVGASQEDSSTTGVQAGAGTPNDTLGTDGDTGAAYVFVRSAGVWTQEAYLKPAAVGTTQAGDLFGGAVAVSGDTVVVGAYREDGSTTGVQVGAGTPNDALGSGGDSGAAGVFVRSGGAWSQEAYAKASNAPTGPGAGDRFGQSVAVSGDTVVVGAYQEDSSATGVNSASDELASDAGAAYVFVRRAGVWTQEAYLKPAAVGTSQAGDSFGFAVAISGDTVVVGAYGEKSSTTGVNSTPNESANFAGAAYVFARSAGVWTQQAYLKPAAVGSTQVGDSFGISVAVAGDTVVVGAIGESSSMTGVNSTPNESAFGAGAAYVFVRSAGMWTQEAYLKPAAVGTTQSNDVFGRSVAVSDNTVVVGAYGEDSSSTGAQAGAGAPNESASGAGAAYVFVRSAGVWSQQAYLKSAVGNPRAGDNFGFSVAVSGDTVVVGASGEDSSTTGVNSTPNAGASNAGAAYVFVRSAGMWSQQAYLKPAAVGTTQAGDLFGISVAVAGDTVVVGANQEDSNTTGVNSTPDESAFAAGAAYVFVRSAGVWAQQAYLKPAVVGTTQVDDRFGISVAVSGDTVVVGAFAEDSSTAGVNSEPDESASSAGAAYLFTLPGTGQTAYEAWAVANGISTDPAALGGANLLAFASGSTPGGTTGALEYAGTLAGSGTITATGQPITRMEGADVRAIFVRRKDYLATCLTYTAQFSATLGVWEDSVAVPTVLADDGTNQIVSVPYPALVAGLSPQFFRIRVTITP